MAKRTFVIAAMACLLSALAPVPVSAQTPEPQPNFAERCGFSHRRSDDPIVKPAQPGGSHSHDFFANRTTDAFSTYESLRAGTTTCRRTADASGYWVPTLLKGRKPIKPAGATFYYRDGGHEPGSIRAFPAGLKVVAGDSAATSPQPLMVAAWSCGEAGTQQQEMPKCPRGSQLHLHVRFPDCWDGANLDSADHRSHMAYSGIGRATRGVCPNTHPVAVPKITFNIRYATQGGRGVTLSSGGVYSAHGDFFNAWDQPVLQGLVDRCLNGQVHCGANG